MDQIKESQVENVYESLADASFSEDGIGGNPAGVCILNELSSVSDKQACAKEVDFSETAFACPVSQKWRVRYFSPENEVPFCGHATIVL